MRKNNFSVHLGNMFKRMNSKIPAEVWKCLQAVRIPSSVSRLSFAPRKDSCAAMLHMIDAQSNHRDFDRTSTFVAAYLGYKSWLSCDSSGLKSDPVYTLQTKKTANPSPPGSSQGEEPDFSCDSCIARMLEVRHHSDLLFIMKRKMRIQKKKKKEYVREIT